MNGIANINITAMILGIIALIAGVYFILNFLSQKASKKAITCLLVLSIVLIPIFGKLYTIFIDKIAVQTTIETTVKSSQIYTGANGFQKIVFITEDGNCWTSFDESLKDELKEGAIVTIVYDDSRHSPSTSRGVEPVYLQIKTT